MIRKACVSNTWISNLKKSTTCSLEVHRDLAIIFIETFITIVYFVINY